MMKLKSALIALSMFVVVGAFLSKSAHAECKEGEERTTTTGAVFTCDTSLPSLGEAWRDPDGVIWGDVLKKANGTRLYANQNKAAEICDLWQNAYLPSSQQFVRLREFLGAQFGRNDGYSHHDDKILPHLSNFWFWSSTFILDNSAAYFFKGSDGFIGWGSVLNLGSVRCVVSR